MFVSMHVLKLFLSSSFPFAVAYTFECFNCSIATRGEGGSHVTMAQTFNPLLFKSTQSQFTQYTVSMLWIYVCVSVSVCVCESMPSQVKTFTMRWHVSISNGKQRINFFLHLKFAAFDNFPFDTHRCLDDSFHFSSVFYVTFIFTRAPIVLVLFYSHCILYIQLCKI